MEYIDLGKTNEAQITEMAFRPVNPLTPRSAFDGLIYFPQVGF